MVYAGVTSHLFSEMGFSVCRDDISGNGGVAPLILTFDGVCR